MKLTTIILIIALAQVSAKGFGQKINLTIKNAPLEKVLTIIKNQTGYVFFYSGKDIQKVKVSVDLKNAGIEEALNECFKNLPFTSIVSEKNILIKQKEPSFFEKVIASFASIDVRGRVTDEKGFPLTGAYIRTESVPLKSYVTGKDGDFFFRGLSEKDRLIVSYVGYQPDTIAVNGRADITIILKQQTNLIEEVVIVNTGYQKINKERATGSFGKPDMQVFQDRAGTLDLMSRLDGQIAGMTVLNGPNNLYTNAISNGVTRQQAVVRGKSSVTISPEPLYVVNGVAVSDFSSINPDDVQDITVLKDAAAAAIWGARATNGVIIVETKRGKNNQKIKIGYSGFTSFQGKPNVDYLHLMNSQEYIQSARETFALNKGTFPYSTLTLVGLPPHEQLLYGIEANANNPAYVAKANASLDSLANIDNRQQMMDLWYNNAMTTNHTVSASGGSGIYNFYTSVNTTSVQSNTPGSKNNSYSFNLSQDFNPGKRFKFSLNTSVINRVSSSKRPLLSAYTALPYQLWEDPNGNGLSLAYTKNYSEARRLEYESRSKISLDYVPLDETDRGHSEMNNLSINVTGNASVQLWKGLSFLGTYGYLKAPGRSTVYDDHTAYNERVEITGLTVSPTTTSVPVYNLPNTGGTLVRSDNSQRNWTVRNQLVYNYADKENKHIISLQAGQDANESYVTNYTNTIKGYREDLGTYTPINYALLATGIANTVTSTFGSYSVKQYVEQDSRSRSTSLFALGSYTFDSKYTIDGSWRRDHSSLVGSDVSAQDKPIYSVGLKWQLYREKFMKNIKWLDALSIRGTYGITGNSPYAGSATLDNVFSVETSGSTLVGGPGYIITSVANEKLSWERTVTKNVGVDFAVFNNRLSGGVEYYHKNTTDLIGSAVANPFTSRTSYTSNIGQLVNSGIEFTLRSVNIRTRDFSWMSSMVFSHNTNKLVSYSLEGASTKTADARANASTVMGYNTSSLWAYRYGGLSATGYPLILKADGTKASANNAAALEDVVYMGNTMPSVNGGFTNTFNYKGIGLQVNMIYNFGAVMRADVNTVYTGRLTGNNVPDYFMDRWKNPGDELITNIPRYTPTTIAANGNLAYYTKGDVNVVSADYVKIRDVALSYALHPRVLRWLKIQSATLRLQVNNFMVWKANDRDIDPEYQNYTSGTRSLPLNQHSVTIGANINF